MSEKLSGGRGNKIETNRNLGSKKNSVNEIKNLIENFNRIY